MEVDKKYLHQVRREIEAMALCIFCAKINGNSDLSLAKESGALDDAVKYAIDLRKRIDNEIKEKKNNIGPTTNVGDVAYDMGSGDIAKL